MGQEAHSWGEIALLLSTLMQPCGDHPQGPSDPELPTSCTVSPADEVRATGAPGTLWERQPRDRDSTNSQHLAAGMILVRWI